MNLKYAAIITIMAMPCSEAICARDPVFKITERSAKNAPVIIVRSQYNFAKSISLKIKSDPARGNSPALIKMISKFGMIDAKGITITSGFDIDKENNLVLGFSGGTSEIIKAAGTPSGFKIIASFKGANGNFTSPPINSLGVYDMSGKKLCFSYETAAMPKMSFTLLLDKSGSMVSVIDDVKITAQDFLKNLPPSAICAVASFNTGFYYEHKNYQSCSGSGFGIKNITAGGDTDIYTPLKDAYETLSRPYFQDHQNAIILISDGYTLSDEARKKELIALKKNVLTFVYFIGGNKRDDLEGIADHFISGGGDLRSNLSQYFKVLERGYKAQKILNVHECKGSNYAAP